MLRNPRPTQSPPHVEGSPLFPSAGPSLPREGKRDRRTPLDGSEYLVPCRALPACLGKMCHSYRWAYVRKAGRCNQVLVRDPAISVPARPARKDRQRCQDARCGLMLGRILKSNDSCPGSPLLRWNYHSVIHSNDLHLAGRLLITQLGVRGRPTFPTPPENRSEGRIFGRTPISPDSLFGKESSRFFDATILGRPERKTKTAYLHLLAHAPREHRLPRCDHAMLLPHGSEYDVNTPFVYLALHPSFPSTRFTRYE